MSEWFIEGFLERLLDPNDAVSRKLLEKAYFYVAPNMNIDGSILTFAPFITYLPSFKESVPKITTRHRDVKFGGVIDNVTDPDALTRELNKFQDYLYNIISRSSNK